MAHSPEHTCVIRQTLVLAVACFIVCPWLAAGRARAGVGASPAAPVQGVAVAADARPLPLDAPSEREIRGGAKDLYSIRFASRQHLRVVIRQRNVDVAVSLLDAGFKELLRVDRANGTRGVETLSLIVEGDQTLYLQVAPVSASAQGGYEMRVEDLRAPDEVDAVRAAAEESFFAGEKLYRQRTNKLTVDERKKLLADSLEKYEEARRLWQQAGDTLSAGRALHSACKANYWLEKYQEALDKCGSALTLERSLPSRWDEAVTLLTASLTKLALAQYEGAWADGQAAEEIFQAEHDERFRAFAAYTLGRINFLQGDIDQALDKYRLALEVRRRLGDRFGEAFVVSAIGRVYFYRVGDNEQALEYYGEALRIAQEVNNNDLTAQVLADIGRLHFDAGNQQLAVENYRQALALEEKIEPRTLAETLTYTGMVYAAEGRYKEALDDYYGRALKLQRDSGDVVGEGHTLHHMGNAYASMGNVDEALVRLQQALSIWQAVFYRAAEADTRYEIARLEVGRENHDKACQQLELALPVVELLRTKVANQSLRTSYFVSVQKYYELYADALMRRYERTGDKKLEALALNVSERRRARALLDTLIESRADLRAGISPGLREEEREVQEALSAASFNSLLPALTREQTARVGKDLDGLIRHYQELEARIRKESPRYAGLRYPTPPALEQIQGELLNRDQMLLEYALGDQRSYLWAVTPGRVESYVLPGRAVIESAVDKLRGLLTERNRPVVGETPTQQERRFEQADEKFEAASAALASMLLLDKGPSLLKAERLLIIGDGALQYLPFSALLVPERRGPSAAPDAAAAHAQGESKLVPLLMYHETEFPLAMSLVAEFKRGRPAGSRPPPTKALAVIADPVFGTYDDRCCKGARARVPATTQTVRAAPEQTSSDAAGRAAREVGLMTDGRGQIARLGLTWYEAQAILSLVAPSKRMAALGFDASLGLLLDRGDELSRYRILHFGTHGLLNNRHPELSGILLSTVDEYGAPQNGFLQMHHIYNLQLQADMVVLSSCETAIGKEVKGEGLAGLSRGFIYAGARRIVGSLWAVHDASTSELMGSFYRHLNIDKNSGRLGIRPASALRLAQLEMWQQRLWRPPYYWAGFVAQGDPD